MLRPAAVLVMLAGLAGLGGLGACRGHAGGGAPCGKVAGRFLQIAREDAAQATLDAATRRAVDEQLPAMRDALAKACSDGEWPAPVRDCMARAADHVALEACEAQLADPQRQALDRAARGETNPP